mmetsp:Transcript_1022/g.2197  ORF Transcript_1022/g.2197 Transcript_1022/m.2197 type:complete len:271 (+) Transcript_1022:73-885(+)
MRVARALQTVPTNDPRRKTRKLALAGRSVHLDLLIRDISFLQKPASKRECPHFRQRPPRIGFAQPRAQHHHSDALRAGDRHVEAPHVQHKRKRVAAAAAAATAATRGGGGGGGWRHLIYCVSTAVAAATNAAAAVVVARRPPPPAWDRPLGVPLVARGPFCHRLCGAHTTLKVGEAVAWLRARQQLWRALAARKEKPWPSERDPSLKERAIAEPNFGDDEEEKDLKLSSSSSSSSAFSFRPCDFRLLSFFLPFSSPRPFATEVSRGCGGG